ncbi:hypothetical protein ASC77_18600 [Nocardioides sp. Root1257]|uniref:site-specific integrase n=1 Tax=unclassified Nocardioides TaxID=2615069 RepID=UPI0006FC5E0D|nr:MULTISPECIES: site-specific integrase [unclassified Nocardioides]KQW45927.1 hypothetical protein ASC77_18600 [Nocardioides sp. Root1257]KRC43191.1 hypothetical protein ASE24_19565 [Nocardioides sp. Root224]
MITTALGAVVAPVPLRITRTFTALPFARFFVASRGSVNRMTFLCPDLTETFLIKDFLTAEAICTLPVQAAHALAQPTSTAILPFLLAVALLVRTVKVRLATGAGSRFSTAAGIASASYLSAGVIVGRTGARFGEMAALKVRRLDLSRRRAVIAESVTPVQGLGLVWGTPKSHQRREVPVPQFLVKDLARHVADKGPDDLVFGGIRHNQPLRVSTFRHTFTTAATAVGMADPNPHELRHTAASLAIASGADVKVVQKMLGHASATMTLDTYGHLFDDRLVAVAMEAARDNEQNKPAAHLPAAAHETGPAGTPTVDPVAISLRRTLEIRNGEDLLINVSAGQEVFMQRTPNGIRTRATAVKVRKSDDGSMSIVIES